MLRVLLVRLSPLIVLGCVVGLYLAGAHYFGSRPVPEPKGPEGPEPVKYLPRRGPEPVKHLPRQTLETSGFMAVFAGIPPWRADASLEEYGPAYLQAIPRGLSSMDRYEQKSFHPLPFMQRATLLNAKGDPAAAYRVLEQLEQRLKGTEMEHEWLYTVIYYKGVTALRAGENDNCVTCRGESACIFPLSPAAVHINPDGSHRAIEQFTEYLRLFPNDLEVRWLLNLAHMTLGGHPHRVDPRHLLRLDAYQKSEFDIGAFRDVGDRVGINRLNQSGGAIMDDFDNDGLFDVVVTSWAPSEPMAFFRNKGDGTFENLTAAAGLDKQTGGLYCVQTDYNNDGHKDIFISRGSWLPAHLHQRPSLLRNNGNGTFTDVTKEAGLLAPTNSVSATWADYDNDGRLDLFVCCQHQPCILYRNKGDGTFENASARAGLPADLTHCLGAAWIDFDNDRYPDLFVNISTGLAGNAGAGTARLFRNNRDGTFADVTAQVGIDGPKSGFSCWAFDFDNDGWLDILATSSSHTLEEVVKGLLHQPHGQPSLARLYRNLGGKGFKDVANEAGLNQVYSPMGSNFADLDNDGFLDFYLATGDPELSTLIPNRMFKNVTGKRFAEITASSRTGHLQKGHGVAFGDWDRNGTQDLFVELGGAVHGDRYHNVLFQNPGQGNNWLGVKLVGQKSNRAAIGARIKAVMAGPNPLTVHRHVTSGSSFGANPLEQHIGLGKADRVALLEVYWPTSGTTQTFRDIPVNQVIEITEAADGYRRREFKPIPLPK